MVLDIMEKQSFDRNCSVIYIALSCLPELIADLAAIAVDSVAYAVEEAICLAVDSNGLYHIIIRAGNKSPAHIVESILSGDHHNRNVIITLTKPTNQLIAGHNRHHNIGKMRSK